MRQPEADEIEVTLLGPGTGESVVVHLGKGRWMIVDSYEIRGVPAAQTYLDGIGVDPSQVEIIVSTHVHRDHYVGVARLHDYYFDASFHHSSALTTSAFCQIFAIDDPDDRLLAGLPGVYARADSRRPSNGREGRRKLQMNSIVYDQDGMVVKALSPTDPAVNASDRDLIGLLQSGDTAKVAAGLKSQNSTSVVLHFDGGESKFLLCADLERSPERFGWTAIVEHPDMAKTSPASLVKVSHHGSNNGHCPEFWAGLVAAEPHLMVAPFWSSRLPREDRDIPELTSIGHCLWQVAPSSRWTTRPDGAKISAPRTTGRVTARRRPSDADWKIKRFPPALLPYRGNSSTDAEGALSCDSGGASDPSSREPEDLA